MSSQPGARRTFTRRLRPNTLAAKTTAAAAASLLALLGFVGLFAASAPPAPETNSLNCTTSGDRGGVPAAYFPWLTEAAARYDLGPRGPSIVAAIHYVESDWDRSPLPGVAPGTENYMGAEGPGQFLVSSWAAYGVDADGDGVKDPYSVPDSVFATARLLRADGAPRDWPGAIYDYNHAWWYVHKVLAKAASLHLTATCTLVADPFGETEARSLERLERAALWIESRRIHYCWGGGHGPDPGPSPGSYCWSREGEQVFGAGEDGLDCSGAVRWLLVLAGFPDPGPLISNEFVAAYPSGLGRAVTIWSNVDHVWIELDGRDWGTADSNFAHGPGFGAQDVEGFAPSHPAGL
jgi:Transglycosylase SLT domain